MTRLSTRLGRIPHGLGWGAIIATMYFCANLMGTFLAIGWLFDATWGSFLLLICTGSAVVTIGMLVGAVVAISWPRRWRFQRHPLQWAALAFLVVIVAACGYALRADRNLPALAERPTLRASNPAPVLWVVLDALRADTLYGEDHAFPLAPQLKAFAEDALVFTDAEASAGWTIPSVATLMTGIHNTTMDASAGFLPDWAPTVAERLRDAGWETRAVVDNALLEPRNGFAAGFESFFQRSGFRFAFSLPSFRALPKSIREGLRDHLYTSYYGAPGVTDVAVDIVNREHDVPLFLYVHYMDPHAPYYPHSELGPEIGPDPEGSESITFWRVRDRVRSDPSRAPTEGQMLLLRHRYANEVRWLDTSLGRLLTAWTERFGDDSMVMVTADHGEEFLDHGHLSHSLTVHREMAH
ncbi:sulfatase, partial [Myxococcota bacterium]